MRQRLCSNSGHHRATIEALAIKSSRGTRSVYTDRFEYVALQSRMCKRGGCGRAARQWRFSFRKSNEANLDEIICTWIYIYIYIFVRHLEFWKVGRKSQGETRIKLVIDRILIWMDFFYRFLTNIKIVYIFGRLSIWFYECIGEIIITY